MQQILVSDIPVDVVRKDIKNMHLSVHPPTGRVRIAVPLQTREDELRLFAISKIHWIRKHQRGYQAQLRQSPREYVDRESHYFLGQRYLLKIIEQDGPGQVALSGKNRIDLYVRPGSSRDQRQRVMLDWYRSELKQRIPPLIAKWEQITGIQVQDWGVKHMKTKWGSCSIEAGRIWLNLELAKLPERCLEYVVLHEMVHLLSRHHNDQFVARMNKFMPRWRSARDEMQSFVLGVPEWEFESVRDD